ncbi:methyltransferase domain-containing protein [uncultured Tateyamaria sp.]|uniref:class I SAM-dependent methyltransferase n=1 Tax=uncultured Tateyamaria sp. TaxID=455651 RepID=UPI002622E9E1|nr:methyltransferase domain-containing protein [uncultured Tateyamaria sp.]
MLHRLARFDRPRTAATGVMQRVYDRAASGWQDGIAQLGFLAAYDHLMAQVDLARPAQRVLDVGTGTGAFATAWTAHHGQPKHLTLMDISPAMLDIAAARLPYADTQANALGDKVQTPPQDVVLCAHVIEHLDDPSLALTWLFDRLTPGGTLVLAMSRPHWCTALVRWRWGNAAYTPTQATQMLRAAGLQDITPHRFPGGPPARVSCGYTARRPL